VYREELEAIIAKKVAQSKSVISGAEVADV